MIRDMEDRAVKFGRSEVAERFVEMSLTVTETKTNFSCTIFNFDILGFRRVVVSKI